MTCSGPMSLQRTMTVAPQGGMAIFLFDHWHGAGWEWRASSVAPQSGTGELVRRTPLSVNRQRRSRRMGGLGHAVTKVPCCSVAHRRSTGRASLWAGRPVPILRAFGGVSILASRLTGSMQPSFRVATAWMRSRRDRPGRSGRTTTGLSVGRAGPRRALPAPGSGSIPATIVCRMGAGCKDRGFKSADNCRSLQIQVC